MIHCRTPFRKRSGVQFSSGPMPRPNRRNPQPEARSPRNFFWSSIPRLPPTRPSSFGLGLTSFCNWVNCASKGLFYGKVTSAELETLKAEAPKHGCVGPLSLHDFVHNRFLPTAFKAGGLVVGFNLPFDLSRLALRHAAARVSRSPRTPEEIEAGEPMKDADRSMVGGFTFQLSPFDDQPWLRIKHRNSRSAFLQVRQAGATGGGAERAPERTAGSVSARQFS